MDFGGGTITSAGGSDIFLAMFDPAGNYLWAQQFGDANPDQYGGAVAFDASGNIVIDGLFYGGTVNFGTGGLTGMSNGSIYLAKFDSSGNAAWSETFDDTGTSAGPNVNAVTTDTTGAILFTGMFNSSMNFGAGALTCVGGRDVFVAKFYSDGSLAWANRYGDAGEQEGTTLAVDRDDNALVAGNFNGSIDFGSGGMTAAGNGDIFLAKLSASGSGIWSQDFGDSSSNNLNVTELVSVDTLGNPVLAGGIYWPTSFGGTVLSGGGGMGTVYPYIAKFTEAGTYAWSYGAATYGSVIALATSLSTNDVLLAGEFGEDGASLDFAGAMFTPPANTTPMFLLELTP